jgi:adenylate cyclase class 2
MGFRPDDSKRKQGRAFSQEGITAELSEVPGLGWFIELEILADNSREETVTEAKKRLHCFLSGLGIEKEAIESRYYTEMLRDKPRFS